MVESHPPLQASHPLVGCISSAHKATSHQQPYGKEISIVNLVEICVFMHTAVRGFDADPRKTISCLFTLPEEFLLGGGRVNFQTSFMYQREL